MKDTSTITQKTKAKASPSAELMGGVSGLGGGGLLKMAWAGVLSFFSASRCLAFLRFSALRLFSALLSSGSYQAFMSAPGKRLPDRT